MGDDCMTGTSVAAHGTRGSMRGIRCRQTVTRGGGVTAAWSGQQKPSPQIVLTCRYWSIQPHVPEHGGCKGMIRNGLSGGRQ